MATTRLTKRLHTVEDALPPAAKIAELDFTLALFDVASGLLGEPLGLIGRSTPFSVLGCRGSIDRTAATSTPQQVRQAKQ